ncbi:hypothetical protein HZF02_23735 [Pseudomonas yamanorum]|nr:hypothetical protein HZF02_23735 [Pseudomonas yamanorum]
MSKVLTEGQKSEVRKQGDDLIEALHQVEEKNELAHSLGLAEGYIKALYACGLLEKEGLQNMLSRAKKTHNFVAEKKGWLTSF